jgi:dTDP-4-amino-4,6-dideoxygalactose transaminase
VADVAIQESLRKAFAANTWGLYHGPHVEELQIRCRKIIDQPNFALASGTLALEIALKSLNIGPGDEIILAAYEYEPTFLTIHALGATPVLVDIQQDNPTLDPKQVAQAIGEKTRVILASHMHGGVADISLLQKVITDSKREIALVQDLSQMPGLDPVPNSDFSILSFGGSKPLSAGRGGMLFCGDTARCQKAKLQLYRAGHQWGTLSELQACVLLPQLEQLKTNAEQRRDAFQRLNSLLHEVPGLRPISAPEKPPLADYYKVGFFFESDAFGLSREIFVRALRAEGIAFSPGFRALHRGRAANRFRKIGSLSHADLASEHLITLHHPVLLAGDSALEQVASAVWKTYRNAERIREAALPTQAQLRFDD